MLIATDVVTEALNWQQKVNLNNIKKYRTVLVIKIQQVCIFIQK